MLSPTTGTGTVITFTGSRHITIGANKAEIEVQTWTAQYDAESEADPIAHNYPSRAEALKALNGYRHAVRL